MALEIKAIPTLHGAAAERFIKLAEVCVTIGTGRYLDGVAMLLSQCTGNKRLIKHKFCNPVICIRCCL